MQYKYLKEKENYESYAAWRVLYSAFWAAPFPVRLIDEIFQRTCDLLGKKDNLRMLDPCIGSWYMMTVLGFLHYRQITSIDWSDTNESMIEFAKKNLHLLTKDGIEKRISELKNTANKSEKQSHIEAMRDGEILKQRIVDWWDHTIKTECKIWSIDKIESLFQGNAYDIIIFDSPYGNLTSWEWDISIDKMYISLSNLLTTWGVLVIVSDKSIKFNVLEWYQKKILNHGKRRITFIKKNF